jgi:hypothetical protein
MSAPAAGKAETLLTDPEAAEVRRDINRHLEAALSGFTRLDAIHAGTEETRESCKRTREARAWLIEDGHAGWIDR